MARNDKASVAKAAKAVDRQMVAGLLRMLAGDRAKARRKPKPYTPTPRPYAPSPTPVSPSPRRRGGPRRSPRRSTDLRTVTWTGFGRMPKYLSKRWKKANFVKEKCAAKPDVRVYNLVGAYYDDTERLDIHDLDVLVEKRLITIS
jgi:hypothetical protein